MNIRDEYLSDYGAEFALVLNRATASDAFVVPADGWFQIATPGEMQKDLEQSGGKKLRVKQVVTAADLDTIVSRFAEWARQDGFTGLLVDFDHFSADPDKSTRAAAWIENVERRADGGLWARLRLTTSGRAALEGGDYRHFSPVLGFARADYREGQEVHPVALLGGAFTNQPTFRGMVPLSNRQGSPLAQTQTSTGVIMDYKASLLALHGLPATASDAEIEGAQAAATAIIAKGREYDATKNRLDALLAAQIERDLDDHGLKGEPREKWKAALTKNRDDALALLAAMGQDGSGYARTHNRDTARAPAGGSGKDKGNPTPTLDQQRDAAVREYQTRNRCSFQDAWDAQRAAKPELFVDPAPAE
jgi:phage I-like protein